MGDKQYGSALIRAVYRYPGFEVIARARDRRKLGKFVAEALFNGQAAVDSGEQHSRAARRYAGCPLGGATHYKI